MSLAASGTYVVNDLLDLSADRQHPLKRLRSFAAGNASLAGGIAVAIGCLAASLSLAFLLPTSFVAVLCAYIGITLLYSWYIKRVPLLDVLTLSGLFTLRVIAGGAAVAIAPSFWLLMFSVFVFLSLALVKRYAELLTMRENGKSVVNGRGYVLEDLPMLEIVGVGSGLISVLVVAFYVHSPEIGVLYRNPEIFWLLCPVGLYLVLRIWMIAHRGQMHYDPVIFVLRDAPSLWTMAVAAGVIWMAL
jgi:4-hydroxybenzoate polyprenyltransferase